MGNRRLRRGNYLQQDDRTGGVHHDSEMTQEWTGLIVRKRDVEPRHPQDLIRAKADRVSVPQPRPVTEGIITYANPVLPEDL